MARRLATLLFAALLTGLSGRASPAVIPIDIFDIVGVPGTGGETTVGGPCYCTQPAYASPVIFLSPGTYDFGTARDYWVKSDATPDGGPDQDNEYVLFAPAFTTGVFPTDFNPLPDYGYPATALCGQDDAACNASYIHAYEDIALVYTVPPGADAAQIELIGNVVYTPPVPEPLPPGMLVLGLACVAGVAATRGRKAPHDDDDFGRPSVGSGTRRRPSHDVVARALRIG